MKIPLFQHITKEGLSGDIPDWVDPLLSALNSSLETMNIALTGRLSFGDNFYSTITTQAFTHGVELTVNPKKAGKVAGIVPINAANATYQQITSYGFNVKTSGSIGVTLYFGKGSDNSAAPAGTVVNCTLLILFG